MLTFTSSMKRAVVVVSASSGERVVSVDASSSSTSAGHWLQNRDGRKYPSSALKMAEKLFYAIQNIHHEKKI